MQDYFEVMHKLCQFAVDLGEETAQDKAPNEITLVDLIVSASTLPEISQSDEICALCGEQHSPLADFNDWIECEICKRWQHQACDGMYNNQALEQLPQFSYHCPLCRIFGCDMHPCNTFEVLARDPKAPIVEEKLTSRQKTGRPKKASSQRAERSRAEDEESNAPGAKTLSELLDPNIKFEEVNQKQLVKFTEEELQIFKFKVIEKETLVEQKRRGIGNEQNPQLLFTQTNAIMNGARLPASRLYCQVQNSFKETQVIQDLNLQNDDIENFNLLAVLIRQHLDATDPYKGSCGPKLPGRRKDSLEQDHERRHSNITAIHLKQRSGVEELPLREMLHLLPILPDDSDLRVRCALSQFDAALENVERLRFRYLKTMVGEAARAVVIYREIIQKQEASIQSQQVSLFEKLAQKYTLGVDWKDIDLSYLSYLKPELLLQDLLDLTNNFEILNSRQTYDLKSRGIKLFPGLAILRASLLNAIVNVGLGMNIFDKHFGEQLTDHIIRFGVCSARNYVIQQVVSNYQTSQLEPGVLFEEPAYQCEAFIGQSINIAQDYPIQDWDILETPSSVLWVLITVQRILEDYSVL